MSQPELLAELRETRPDAPPALRARVLELTEAQPPRRRPLVTPRRALAVLVAATAAAGIAAGVVHRGSSPGPPAVTPLESGAASRAQIAPASPVPPSRTRLQNYDATLSLRVQSAAALSAATRRAVLIARSLGGFESFASVDTNATGGDATLRLRVPATHVQEAVERLSALGTITAEHVSVQDAQAGLNALDRRIASLQRRLKALRAQTQTDAVTRQIAALTGQVQRLQRQRADAIRQARLATISLQLTTRTPPAPPQPVHHGPLHGAVVALRWLGIAALYALVVGGPVAVVVAAVWLAARALRRRGERRLLERP